jgi:hypothetical protein
MRGLLRVKTVSEKQKPLNVWEVALNKKSVDG